MVLLDERGIPHLYLFAADHKPVRHLFPHLVLFTFCTSWFLVYSALSPLRIQGDTLTGMLAGKFLNDLRPLLLSLLILRLFRLLSELCLLSSNPFRLPYPHLFRLSLVLLPLPLPRRHSSRIGLTGSERLAVLLSRCGGEASQERSGEGVERSRELGVG